MCLALGDHFHGIGRKRRIDAPDQRKVLTDEIADNIALGQRQGFSGQIIQRPRAVRRHACDQHRWTGQKRPRKHQVLFTPGTEAYASEHVDLTAFDRRHHLRH
ncbi:hypothetical protein D3C86_1732900 [compost metagenome]